MPDRTMLIWVMYRKKLLFNRNVNVEQLAWWAHNYTSPFFIATLSGNYWSSIRATRLSGIDKRLSFDWPLKQQAGGWKEIVLSVFLLADAFQCLGLSFCSLPIKCSHQRQLAWNKTLRWQFFAVSWLAGVTHEETPTRVPRASRQVPWEGESPCKVCKRFD